MANKEKPYFADYFNYVYLFHKKWSGTGYGDAEWEQIIKEAGEISKKIGKENLYGMNLLYDAVSEIERHNGGLLAKRTTKNFLISMLMKECGVDSIEKLCLELLPKEGD